MTAAALEHRSHYPPLSSLPALGEVPKEMDAWVIRKERLGEPLTSFKREKMATPGARPRRGARARDGRRRELQRHLGRARQAGQHPRRHEEGLPHRRQSDASGVVWKLGQGVTRWKVGDEVVLHCNMTCGQCAACNGFDPMACEDQKIWGYETPYGSFAQFTLVQAQQLLKKPKAAVVGGRGELRARLLHRVPHARRSRARAPRARTSSSGARAGPRHLRRADHEAPRRDVDRRRVVAVEGRSSPRASGATTCSYRNEYPGLAYQPNETPEQTAKARIEATKKMGKRIWEMHRREEGARRRLRARGARDVPHERVPRQPHVAHRHLRRDDRLQPDLRRAPPLDAPEVDHRLPLRERRGVHAGQRARASRARSSRSSPRRSTSRTSPTRTT